MDKPVVLWSDLTLKGGSPELRKQFESECEVRCVGSAVTDASGIVKGQPKFGCLEYDYPDKQGLSVLQTIKGRYPSLPLVMITLAHSEDLAVWAFRTGVWEYLRKPVTAEELERVFARMHSLNQARKSNSSRQPTLDSFDLPTEAQYVARSKSAQSVFPALTYIQSHYAEKVSEKKLAELCQMSTFRFSRAFREYYGITFREWILKYRLEQAKRLLGNPDLSITNVAYMTGFNDTSHFGKMFRRYFDQTATEFRSQLENEESNSATERDSPAEPEHFNELRLSLHPRDPWDAV